MRACSLDILGRTRLGIVDKRPQVHVLAQVAHTPNLAHRQEGQQLGAVAGLGRLDVC